MTTRVLVLTALFGVACGDDDGVTRCATAAECAPGQRCVNGRCAAPTVDGGTDAAPADAGGADAAPVDTSGACGVVCEGGTQRCAIYGFDPADGLEPCTLTCQAAWPEEASCAGLASWLLECVDANGACRTLRDETCRTYLEDLRDCAMPL